MTASAALEVMRRGDIGPSGVAAVTLVLLLDAAALASLLASAGGSVLAVVALVSSRQLLAWACARPVPPARAEGLGATVAGSVTPAAWALSTAAVAVLAVGAGLAADLAWWAGPVVLAAAVAAGALVVRRAVVRLGGITGDVLGAVVEVALAVGLTAAAVVLPHAT